MFNFEIFSLRLFVTLLLLLVEKVLSGLDKFAERKEVLFTTDRSIKNWNHSLGRGRGAHLFTFINCYYNCNFLAFFSALGQSPNQHCYGSRCFHVLDHFSEQIILATNQSAKDGFNESNSFDGCFLRYLTFTFSNSPCKWEFLPAIELQFWTIENFTIF